MNQSTGDKDQVSRSTTTTGLYNPKSINYDYKKASPHKWTSLKDRNSSNLEASHIRHIVAIKLVNEGLALREPNPLEDEPTTERRSKASTKSLARLLPPSKPKLAPKILNKKFKRSTGRKVRKVKKGMKLPVSVSVNETKRLGINYNNLSEQTYPSHSRGDKKNNERRMVKGVSIGDSNINNMNRIFLAKNQKLSAEEIWE
ncbi:hypothetical protein Ancab_018723 [Ancistrocladus abbreviatus]